MKGIFSFIWEVFKIVVIALLIVVPIRYFVFQPHFVKGQSMEPAFEDRDYLITEAVSYRFRDPLRGEVIVFKNPQNPRQRFIKRIIGLPGETVEIKEGKIFIFSGCEFQNSGLEKPLDKQAKRKTCSKKMVLEESSYLPPSTQTHSKLFEKITLKENEYFVLGDNRPNSTDSRVFGPLPRENIVGRVILRAWPLTAFDKIETPTYKK